MLLRAMLVIFHQFRDNEFDVAFSNSVIETFIHIRQSTKNGKGSHAGCKNIILSKPRTNTFRSNRIFKFPFFPVFCRNKMKLFSANKDFGHQRPSGIKKRRTQKTIIKEIRLLFPGRIKQPLFRTAIYILSGFLGLSKSFIAHNLPDTPNNTMALDRPASPAILHALRAGRLSNIHGLCWIEDLPKSAPASRTVSDEAVSA